MSSHHVVLSEISPLVHLRHVAAVSSGELNVPELATKQKSGILLDLLCNCHYLLGGATAHRSCNMVHIALLQGVSVACFLVDY